LSAILLAILAASQVWGAALAVSDSPAQIAESIRSALVQAQLSLTNDPNASAQLVHEAETAYQTGLSDLIAVSNPEAHQRITSAFDALAAGASRDDMVPFAAARAQAEAKPALAAAKPKPAVAATTAKPAVRQAAAPGKPALSAKPAAKKS